MYLQLHTLPHLTAISYQAQSALSIAQSEGLDFTSFLKLLVMACIFALSKTTPLSSRYSTVKVGSGPCLLELSDFFGGN